EGFAGDPVGNGCPGAESTVQYGAASKSRLLIAAVLRRSPHDISPGQKQTGNARGKRAGVPARVHISDVSGGGGDVDGVFDLPDSRAAGHSVAAEAEDRRPAEL